ncbi:Fic family protein [Desulfolutivibrio sp.]|uniref:Fic family protein n=1 Tax=Desulfolutivibrio sp. TaxID=2773296 RepID=UPI002F964B5A
MAWLAVGDALAASAPQVTPQVTPQVGQLLRVMQGDMPREAVQHLLRLQDRKSFRERSLGPALADGLVEMTIADRPASRRQRCRLTEKGRRWRKGCVEEEEGGGEPCIGEDFETR